MKIPSKFRPLLTVTFVGAALAYLGYRLHDQWNDVAAHEWHIRWGMMVLSLFLTATWFLLRARLWHLALLYLGESIGFLRAWRIWALSDLGRYLPGKFWHILGRSYLASEEGVRASVALLALAIELAMIVIVAGVCFFVGVTVTATGTPVRITVLVTLFLVVVLVAQPRFLPALINVALRRLGRPTIDARLSAPQLLKLFGLAVATWVGFGAAFLTFSMSVWDVSPAQYLQLLGGYAGAWVVGLVAIVAPGGIGVRESVLAGLLAPSVPEPGALVLSLVSRIWISVAEALFAIVAVVAAHRRHP